ncbi:predicted protein [Chaetoceros tenuissimus]|uniref:Heterokaryon incompatibility domain-containing protein n=1 Tax=Chaetoceros tenuissimus TaxID=426638 RepID=A0AAD3GYT8_9STRA|nr:predicted protein [Chaetoceros tenuissimus]
MFCCNTSIQKLGYEKSLAKGQIQVLRLASLDENGNIKVQSVDIEVNDDTFQDVGICSYTWGFDRVEWYDEETGMAWEVASRCEDMCKAALKFYPRVWIDGLCMIQVWKNHVSDNMKIMGRLYWHGNVVPEMVLEQMAPEYPLRGWVQQEISFTNLQYCITPLQKWFNANQKLVQELKIYLKQKEESNGDTSELTYPEEPFDYVSFHEAVDASIPFFNVLSRATEGRNSKDAIALKEKIASLLSTFQGHLFMGSFGPHTLEAILSMDMNLTGVLKRESNTEGSINGAVQSFRTGFFRYNSDRTVASFSLAGYICGEEDLTLFTKKIEAGFVPRPLVGVTITGNPGRTILK